MLDASSSMSETDWSPSRGEAAIDAGIAFVQRLQIEEPTARVGVVAYSDRSRLVCSLTSVLIIQFNQRENN